MAPSDLTSSPALNLGWLTERFWRSGAKGEKEVDDKQRRIAGSAQWWPAFDMADVMEEGLAQDLTSEFVRPRPSGSREVETLYVECTEDLSTHVIGTEDGQPLLIARGPKQGTSIDIFIATGGDPPTAVGPAFTLSKEEISEESVVWKLTTDKCECCAYVPEQVQACCRRSCRRELATIKQTSMVVGRGKVMKVEVELPQIRADGTFDVLCLSAGASCEQKERLCLASRMPKWSWKSKALTLDFYGRVTKASVRNIQLLVEGSAKGVDRYPEFLFGKVAPCYFVLDYKHPLGVVQAFALALSSRDWN